MNKYYEILELNIIIEQLKTQLLLDSSRKKIDDLQPFSTIEDTQIALDEVDEAVILTMRLGRIPFYFKSDISYQLEKVNKDGILQISELMEIEKFLDTVKGVINYIAQLDSNNITCDNLKRITTSVNYPKHLNVRIKEIVSPFGEINDTASSTLKDIRRKIKDTEKNIQNKLQSIMSANSSKLSQTLISIRNDRYVLPVKNDHKNSIKGIIHDQSASGETVFIEPLIICELNNALNTLFENEKKEIHRILREISGQIGEEYYSLIEDYNILEQIDLLFAKAQHAILIDGAKPKINNRGIVKLYNCKHPLLKVEKIVKNDITIGETYKGIIITGPNTGGKTVLMKTVGLLSLMVKFGLLIPADTNSDIMLFDAVYADIGDDQSIAQNLSTFSSHLKNVIDIIDNVTADSLVLLDELGSGTDPVEGASLAIAIYDYLIAKNCLVIASSHYSELKVHAYQADNVINASVEFDNVSLKPTYKLLLGVPGASNALNISKMLGLNQEIIDKAFTHIDENKNELSSILAKLINQSNELQVRLKEVEIEKSELESLKASVNDELLSTVLKRNEILKNAEKEAKKIIEKSNKKIDEILAELNAMKLREVKQHEIADIKYAVRSLKEEANIEEETVAVDLPITINSPVFVSSYNCSGIIVKEKKNNKYDVQIGNAIVTVDKAMLKPIKKTEVIIPKKNVEPYKAKTVSMTLDLRGERYESAAIKIEKYLDDAVYSGLSQVSIIHGFGTGTIRELVKKTLHSNSNVESFRYGGENEGGQGVTIAILKK